MGLNHRGVPPRNKRGRFSPTRPSRPREGARRCRDSGAGRVRVQVSVGTKSVLLPVSCLLDIEVCSLKRARNEDTRGSLKVLRDTIVSNGM